MLREQGEQAGNKGSELAPQVYSSMRIRLQAYTAPCVYGAVRIRHLAYTAPGERRGANEPPGESFTA